MPSTQDAAHTTPESLMPSLLAVAWSYCHDIKQRTREAAAKLIAGHVRRHQDTAAWSIYAEVWGVAWR